MSNLKVAVVVALAVMLTALAVLGGAWKWTKPHPSGASIEHVAGWTWDDVAFDRASD
jgi:hypothetical protein